jgi:DNA-binding transcriptional LysR family regulator
MKRRENEQTPPLPSVPLATFTALARWRKQAAVEKALGKSQSQVSRDLAALEKSLGRLTLFDRRRRAPTPAGERVLAFAADLSAGWDRLCSGLAGDAEVAGKVVLAVEPEVSGPLSAPLADLRRNFPGLSVRFMVRPAAVAADALRSGEADAAVLALAFADARGLSARPLMDGAVTAAIPTSWATARKRRISPADLRDETILVPPPGASLRAALDAAFARCRGQPPRLSEVDSRSAALDAVAAGLGAAIILEFAGGVAPASGLLESVALRPSVLPMIQFSLAIRRGRPAGGPAEALIKHLLRWARMRV